MSSTLPLLTTKSTTLWLPPISLRQNGVGSFSWFRFLCFWVSGGYDSPFLMLPTTAFYSSYRQFFNSSSLITVRQNVVGSFLGFRFFSFWVSCGSDSPFLILPTIACSSTLFILIDNFLTLLSSSPCIRMELDLSSGFASSGYRFKASIFLLSSSRAYRFLASIFLLSYSRLLPSFLLSLFFQPFSFLYFVTL